MIHALHTAIVWTIRRLPLPVAVQSFRVYNKVLKTINAEHIGRTYFNARMFCDPRDLIQRMILHFGVWEPEVSRVIERSLSPGDVFVDIGANVGYDTLLGSRLVGATGSVVAIEASPGTFALLTRNLQLNAVQNVRAVNLAVSDKETTVDLYDIDDHNIGAVTTLTSRGGVLIASVPAQPLEGILSPDEMSRLRLIKMDVEGAEPAILQHLLAHLSLYPTTMDIIVEASPRDNVDSWRDVFDRLRGAGFVAYAIENRYELEWYLGWRKSVPLQEINALAPRQQDLLFSRSAVQMTAGAQQ